MTLSGPAGGEGKARREGYFLDAMRNVQEGLAQVKWREGFELGRCLEKPRVPNSQVSHVTPRLARLFSSPFYEVLKLARPYCRSARILLGGAWLASASDGRGRRRRNFLGARADHRPGSEPALFRSPSIYIPLSSLSPQSRWLVVGGWW